MAGFIPHLKTKRQIWPVTKSNNSKDSGQAKTRHTIDWSGISNSIHNGLSELFLEDTCTDFEIEAGRKTFRCHKVVLASVSDYFKAMFCSGMKETTQNKAKFEDISAAAFETLFSILYRQNDQVSPFEKTSEEDMTEVFKMAVRMQIPFLITMCEEHFQKTMSLENCVDRLKLGELMLCDEITNLSWVFIEENFQKLTSEHRSQLLALDFHDILSLIRGLTHIDKEEKVWEFMRDWVKSAYDERSAHIVPLLKECSLILIDKQYLMEEISFDPLVRKSDEASQLIKEALKFENNPGDHGNVELKFRASSGKDQSTVLICRKKAQNANVDEMSLMVRNRRKSAWIDWKLPERAGNLSACCVHGNSLYVIGGVHSSALFEFNGTTKRWATLREMPQKLIGHAMAATNGHLYVLGGNTGLIQNTRVFIYTIGNNNVNNWKCDGEMLAPVMNGSCLSMDSKLYLFGGEIDGVPAHCVQMYNTETKSGTIFTHLPMPVPWSRVVCRGTIAYVVTCHGDVIQVSLETEDTKIIATIPGFQRTNFGIDLREGELTVYGGIGMRPKVARTENVDGKNDTKPTSGGQKDVSRDLFDSTFVVDILTGKVEDGEKLPQPCEVLGFASLVHRTEPDWYP